MFSTPMSAWLDLVIHYYAKTCSSIAKEDLFGKLTSDDTACRQ